MKRLSSHSRTGHLLPLLMALVILPGPQPATALEGPQEGEKGADSREDPLPPGARLRLGSAQFRHGGPVTSIAYSPDGKLIASGDRNGVIQLWDPETGRRVRTITVRWDLVLSLAFSPDGKTLVAGTGDGVIHSYDPTDGSEQIFSRYVVAIGTVNSVAFSPDGKSLAAGGWRKTAKIWDVSSGKIPTPFGRLTLSPHEGPVESVAFSPDGKLLASGSGDKLVRLWDPATGKRVRRLKGHYGPVRSVTFSPDGKTLASTGDDGKVVIWEVDTGTYALTIHLKGRIFHHVAFSPDGETIAAGADDGTIRLWEVASGDPGRTLQGHGDQVSSIAFSPDGKTLASGSADHTIQIWDLETGKERFPSAGHRGLVCSLDFSPDGKVLATAGTDRTVHLWDPSSGEETLALTGHEGTIRSVTFSPDGKTLASASADKTVRIWDRASGEERLRFPFPEGVDGPYAGLAYSPDGKAIVCWFAWNHLGRWEVEGDEARLAWETTWPAKPPPEAGVGHPPQGWPDSVALSPDGRTVATPMHDKGLWIGDAGNGTMIAEVPGTRKVDFKVGTAAVFSPDSSILAFAGRDRRVHLLEVATLNESRMRGDHGGAIPTIAFAPDGRTVASGGRDGSVRIWEVATGEELAHLAGHKGDVHCVAISPDGRTLASASVDSTVILWDLGPIPREREAGPPDAKALGTLWEDLAGKDVPKAYDAIWRLAEAPEVSVPFLVERLRRLPEEIPRRIGALITALDDDDFAVREKAHEELAGLGEEARDAIRDALANPASPEVRERATRLLASLGPFTRKFPSETIRRRRAIHALEMIGTSEAREVMELLAEKSPLQQERTEAREALSRLSADPAR